MHMTVLKFSPTTQEETDIHILTFRPKPNFKIRNLPLIHFFYIWTLEAKAMDRYEDMRLPPHYSPIFLCLLSDLWKRDGPVPGCRWKAVVYLWTLPGWSSLLSLPEHCLPCFLVWGEILVGKYISHLWLKRKRCNPFTSLKSGESISWNVVTMNWNVLEA